MKCFMNCSLLVLVIGVLVWDVCGKAAAPSYMKCPRSCVCQYAHFMDLPISRWINFVRVNRPDRSTGSRGGSQETQEELVNDNEVMYQGDDEGLMDNPFIKQATCILQVENDLSELVRQLPMDLQALVLMYTAQGKNKTVPTSVFKPLNQLATLEIRGPRDRSFRLIIDEPMAFLRHANFESIALVGSENYKRPKNPVHPRESFDYVPSSEQVAYNISLESVPEEEIEILPYEVYIMEIKKSRMATFYGWEHLEVLRINHCKLDELHWEMFDGLLALQHLSLEHNEIKIVPAFALYGAMHIKTLSLAHNYILDLNYRSLAGLLELEVLDLSHNSLTKLSELSFPPFPKLEYVDFRHNPIRYIFPASFGIMNSTQIMHMGSKETATELWGNIPFESMDMLRILTITNVSIGALDHDVFQGLRSLEELNLKGQIRSIEFDAFADMSQLRELNLSDCAIREISMDAFFGCKKIEILDLSRNNLSYIPPGLLDDKIHLREVYLQSNNLKFLPSTFFHNPSFKLVRLTENPWRCNCDMALWKQKVTNQLRGDKTTRCVKEFNTRKVLSCHKADNYKFEKALSPRCENFNGHSVYYAVRKDIRCNFKKEIAKRLKYHMSHSYQRTSQRNMNEERRDMQKNKLQMKSVMHKQSHRLVVPWYLSKAYNGQRTMDHPNSLKYLAVEATQFNKKSQDLPNNIVGKSIDEQLALNDVKNTI